MRFSDGNSSMERFRAIFLLVLTAFLWSFGGLLIKSVHLNPVAIAGTRSAIAALLMTIIFRDLRFQWSLSLIGGAAAYTATVIFFVIANKLTTAANAILLQYTAPVYTAILGIWFLKEKVTKFDWVIILLVMTGMTLFFLDNLTIGNLLGNFCAILAGISFASTAIFLRKQKNASPVKSVILGNIFTAVIGLPFISLGPLPDAFGWMMLVILGVFQLGVSYILFTMAIKHVTALESMLIPVFEPLLNPLWVFLFLGEKPGRWALLGGILVLSSVTARCIIVALHERAAVSEKMYDLRG